jgi:hypothetical protein
MREAFTVVRAGAKVNRDKRAGNLKNPLARGRRSESGAKSGRPAEERVIPGAGGKTGIYPESRE